MTWLKNHQAKILEHFVYLHSKQADYGRHALKVYDKSLYPTIEQELEASLKTLKQPSAGTKEEGRWLKPEPYKRHSTE
jgi:hypothetical protein